MGMGLELVATSQLIAVEETTIGTTQGSSSRTLKMPPAGDPGAQQQRQPKPDGPAAEDPDHGEDQR